MTLHRVIAVCLALAACGGSDPSTPRPTVFGGDRPVTLQAPDPLEPGKLYPLVLILHGYGASSFVQQAYFGMKNLAINGDAFVLAPDGLVDSGNRQFWNADGVCCDFDHKNPDDSTYLSTMVTDVMAAWPVDPQRVLSIGHSNGGWMTYRLACDHADLFTDAIVLAGDTVQLPCHPADKINLLHMHGSADTTVTYTEANVDTWAQLNGCTGTRKAGADMDLEGALVGAETKTFSTDGCPAGGTVDLWKIEGAGHIPNLNASWEPSVWQWFMDHPRP
jgi:polyhydroxybutyrate depolymerase